MLPENGQQYTARQFMKQLAVEEKTTVYLVLFDEDGTTTKLKKPKFNVPSSEIKVSSRVQLLHGGRRYLVEILAFGAPEEIELIDIAWPDSLRGQAILAARLRNGAAGGFLALSYLEEGEQLNLSDLDLSGLEGDNGEGIDVQGILDLVNGDGGCVELGVGEEGGDVRVLDGHMEEGVVVLGIEGEVSGCVAGGSGEQVIMGGSVDVGGSEEDMGGLGYNDVDSGVGGTVTGVSGEGSGISGVGGKGRSKGKGKGKGRKRGGSEQAVVSKKRKPKKTAEFNILQETRAGGSEDVGGSNGMGDYLDILGNAKRVEEFNRGAITITAINPPHQGECCIHCPTNALVLAELKNINEKIDSFKEEIDRKMAHLVEMCTRQPLEVPPTTATTSTFPPVASPTTPDLLPDSIGVGVGLSKQIMALGAYKEECDFTPDLCVIPDHVVGLVEERSAGNATIFASAMMIALFGAEDLRGRAVDGSREGKVPLSPRRLNAIKSKVFEVHSVPHSQRQEKWHRCKKALNSKLRNLRSKGRHLQL